MKVATSKYYIVRGTYRAQHDLKNGSIQMKSTSNVGVDEYTNQVDVSSMRL